MTDQVVKYALEDGLAVIRFDDGKVNVLRAAVMDEITGHLERARSEAGAVVIFGRPGNFSAGFDLREMQKGPDQARAVLRRGGEFLNSLFLHPQPVITAVTGHTVAGAALVLLTADARIGVRGDFKIGLSEVASGIPLPVMGVELAQLRLKSTSVLEATLHAQLYSPEEACEVGFLDSVVDAADIERAAFDAAKQLSKLPAPAYASTKTRVRSPMAKRLVEGLESDLQALGLG